jgi:MSHA biogenesis protein MshQ
VTAVKDSDIDGEGSDNNPATQASGSGFVAAGESFTVALEARGATEILAPNFGLESSPATAQLNIDSITYPVGGDGGNLAGAAAIGVKTAGIGGELESTTVTWDNVGSLNLSAAISGGDYLSAGDVSTARERDPGVDAGIRSAARTGFDSAPQSHRAQWRGHDV